MTTRLRALPILASTALLAFAGPATAAGTHDWHGGGGWNGPSDQPRDNSGWNDDAGWPDSGNSGTTPTTNTTDGSAWDGSQGDPPETPAPSQDGSGSQGTDNGWPSLDLPRVTSKTVAGKKAMLRTDGKAAIPRGAPKRVRAIVAAANEIIGKKYKWGGGHGRLFDSGYDCSGAVSYALIRSGLLGYPMVSGTLAHWGLRGSGKYISIYANKSHVYMEVAGLRLDTSSVGDYRGKSGVRWRPVIGRRVTFAARHIAGM